jgi:hypothetical protein
MDLFGRPCHAPVLSGEDRVVHHAPVGRNTLLSLRLGSNLVTSTLHEEQDGSLNPPAPLKNPHAAALGRLGGLKGGIARALRLSPARRREIARKAARARWRKQKT